MQDDTTLVSENQRRYQSRIARGKCASCSGLAANGCVRCDKCQSIMKSASKRWRQSRIVEHKCALCGVTLDKSYTYKNCPQCLVIRRAKGKIQHLKLKIEVLNAYGGCQCVCCGETILAFLSLDHVHNDGAAHRQTMAKGGNHFYRQLKKNGWPNNPPLQVLCHNCNTGRQVNGGICPHQEIRDVSI